MPPPSNISITVTASNQVPFAPRNSSVALGGTVKFQGSSGSVDTLVNNVRTTIFSQGNPPYSVPHSGYTLISTISGTVTIKYIAPSLSGREEEPPTTPTNGTINVGGGKDEPGDGEEPPGGGEPR